MTDVGQTLNGRYALTRMLGSGGMAQVYLADDLTLVRQVAIKMLHPELAEDAKNGAEIGARFLREARIFASLKHPHIIDIYDVLELDDGRVAMVMEFIDGTDLSEVLVRGVNLVPELAVLLLRPVADALSYAHACGVIHRDVKPANVLLGRDGTMKLADFGIAKATEQTHITRTGDFLGTPAYIAPEQARGEPIGPAADQFALGVMLYEMVTGKRPFDASTPVAILSKVLIGHYEDPRRLSKAIDERIATVINRALADKPGKRFESLTDLLEALRPDQPLGAERLRSVIAELIAHPTHTAQAVAREVASTYVGIGRAAFDTDRTDDARDAALKALARDPEHAEAQALLDSMPGLEIPVGPQAGEPFEFAETAEARREAYSSTPLPVRVADTATDAVRTIDVRAETDEVGPAASIAVREYRAREAARADAPPRPKNGRWVVLVAMAIAALIGGGITWMLRTLPAGSNAHAVARPSVATQASVPSAARGLPPRALPSDALQPTTPGSPTSTAPSSTAPSSTGPSSGAPSSGAPSSMGPKSASPKSAAPRTAAPRRASPKSAAPRTAAPKAILRAPSTASKSATPDAASKPAMAAIGEPGTLQVQVNPWGDLTVDGVARSQGKLKHPPLTLTPGPHSIAVRHPKWGTQRRSVTIQSGKTTTIKVVLK
ncbi:MAG: tRNA A-37 threonylcarbamoyl transferase component Bud32 [Bradymonadia bacterium]